MFLFLECLFLEHSIQDLISKFYARMGRSMKTGWVRYTITI